MLDHVTRSVTDLARAQAFYDAALAAIGTDRRDGEGAMFAFYGAGGKAFFWIGIKPPPIASVDRFRMGVISR
jgi:catechol 2,3-dioxygenase-like lactoylglutathione lyase family enzyme